VKKTTWLSSSSNPMIIHQPFQLHPLLFSPTCFFCPEYTTQLAFFTLSSNEAFTLKANSFSTFVISIYRDQTLNIELIPIYFFFYPFPLSAHQPTIYLPDSVFIFLAYLA
jgi:hypothetical protein